MASQSNVPSRRTRVFPLLAALLVAVPLVGCGSKEEEAAVPPPAPPAEETAAAPAQEESTTDDISMPQVDVAATMGSADKAMQQNDYVAATDALLKLQMSGAMKNNDQAKVDHYARMVELQRKVAEAAASGDAKAQRAAALLRQGSAR